jgi:S-adenosylmethionine hydrolase
MEQVIALITDFGSKGQHYVAQMKGVILKINPDVHIIDISHNLTSYSIIEAAYLLSQTFLHYPKYTIFIIVVDPGVGSSREILGVKTISDYYYIGPNNGIFSNFYKELISESVIIQNKKFFNHPVSNTFHGRDIMAPVGAFIAKGTPLKEFGPNCNYEQIIKLPFTNEFKGREIKCIVQYIDSFGNIITSLNVEQNILYDREGAVVIKLEEDSVIKVSLGDKTFEGIFTTHYSEVPKNSILFLVGSSSSLEISKNQGNAAKDIGFKVGDIITISL